MATHAVGQGLRAIASNRAAANEAKVEAATSTKTKALEKLDAAALVQAKIDLIESPYANIKSSRDRILTCQASRAVAKYVDVEMKKARGSTTQSWDGVMDAEEDDWFAKERYKGLKLPPAGVAQRPNKLLSAGRALSLDEANRVLKDEMTGKKNNSRKSKSKRKHKKKAAEAPAALTSTQPEAIASHAGQRLQASTLANSVQRSPTKLVSIKGKGKKKSGKLNKDLTGDSRWNATYSADQMQQKSPRDQTKKSKLRGKSKSADFSNPRIESVEDGGPRPGVGLVSFKIEKETQIHARGGKRLSAATRQVVGGGGSELQSLHAKRIQSMHKHRVNTKLSDVLPDAHYEVRKTAEDSHDWAQVNDYQALVAACRARGLPCRGRAFKFSKFALQDQLRKWDKHEATIRWNLANMDDWTADREKDWKNKGKQVNDIAARMAMDAQALNDAADAEAAERLYSEATRATENDDIADDAQGLGDDEDGDGGEDQGGGGDGGGDAGAIDSSFDPSMTNVGSVFGDEQMPDSVDVGMEQIEDNEEGDVQVETNDTDSLFATIDQAENGTGNGGGAGGGAAANAAANMGVDLELADADAAAEFMKSQLADNSTFVENSGWLSENSAAMSENNGAELSADALEELMGGHQDASAYDVFTQNAIVGDSADAVYIGGF